MAREFKRSDRLGEQIQREVAELLQFQSREPLPGLDGERCIADPRHGLCRHTHFGAGRR